MRMTKRVAEIIKNPEKLSAEVELARWGKNVQYELYERNNPKCTLARVEKYGANSPYAGYYTPESYVDIDHEKTAKILARFPQEMYSVIYTWYVLAIPVADKCRLVGLNRWKYNRVRDKAVNLYINVRNHSIFN